MNARGYHESHYMIDCTVTIEVEEGDFCEFETQLSVLAHISPKRPATRVDPAEGGITIEGVDIVITADMRKYLGPSTSLRIDVSGDHAYAETANQPVAADADYLCVDESALDEILANWIDEYEAGKALDAYEQRYGAMREYE